MSLKQWIILGCVALMVSGCGIRERLFGGGGQADRALPFRTSLVRGDDDRRNVAVRVQAPGQTVAAVRESVRFQATRYCLTSFGGADTRWQIDPVTGDWAFTREGGDMVFRGRCVSR